MNRQVVDLSLLLVVAGSLGCLRVGAQNPAVVGAWSAPINLHAMISSQQCNPGLASPNPCSEIGHATLIPVGEKAGWILFWRADGNACNAGTGQTTYLWDPSSGGGDGDVGTVLQIPIENNPANPLPPGVTCPAGDVFCSGSAFLPDGRLVVAGGNAHDCTQPNGLNGSKQTWLFDPQLVTGLVGPWTPWFRLPDMARPRWYPTIVALLTGDLFVAGGLNSNCGTYPNQNYVFEDNFETMPAATLAAWTQGTHGLPGVRYFAEYPHIRLLTSAPNPPWPTANLLVASAGDAAFFLPGTGGDGNRAWLFSPTNASHTGAITPSLYRREDLNTVQLPIPGSTAPLDRWTLVGGADFDHFLHSGVYQSEVWTSSPVWTVLGNQIENRTLAHSVTLPDGSAIAFGGTERDFQFNVPLTPYIARYTTERLDPQLLTWSLMAPIAHRRNYHAEALLLPDGRVVVMGGAFYNGAPPAPFGVPTSKTFESDAEIYSPPYLFTGPRPALQPSGTVATFGTTFDVKVDVPPAASNPPSSTNISLVLIRPGTATHGLDFEHRVIPLAFTVQAVSSPSAGWTKQILRATIPPANQHPPGYYMLFAVTLDSMAPANSKWIPSIAQFVKLQ